jgi:hypothetical protein
VRKYFDEHEIYYEPAIIDGKLQDAVEGRYIQHLRKLGVSSRNLTTESGAKRYFILFNWVYRDFPYRERFVKTGFPSWEKRWRKTAQERYNKYRSNKRSVERDDIIRRANEISEHMLEKTISVQKLRSRGQKREF